VPVTVTDSLRPSTLHPLPLPPIRFPNPLARPGVECSRCCRATTQAYTATGSFCKPGKPRLCSLHRTALRYSAPSAGTSCVLSCFLTETPLSLLNIALRHSDLILFNTTTPLSHHRPCRRSHTAHPLSNPPPAAADRHSSLPNRRSFRTRDQRSSAKQPAGTMGY
jgi:hypothetical protein